MTLKDLLKFLYLTSFPLRSIRLIRIIRLIPAISIPLLLFTITIYFYLLRDLPSPRSLSSQPLPLTTHIRDRNGQVLYKIYKNQNRTLVKLTDLPVALRQAVISIEDSQFYSHNGYSPTSILRALIKNLNCATGKPALPAGGLANCKTSLQGGSTITQQLVKTSLLTPEKTLKRKARELVLAIAVEALHDLMVVIHDEIRHHGDLQHGQPVLVIPQGFDVVVLNEPVQSVVLHLPLTNADARPHVDRMPRLRQLLEDFACVIA